MICEHYFEHDKSHETITCIVCNYSEPDGCFAGLCLHDQVLVIEFEREDKDNPTNAQTLE